MAGGIIKTVVKQAAKQASKKEKLTDAQRKKRAELRRLISIGNKRLDRLEKAGITQSAALEKWKSEGGVRFSVKGKSNKELQKEYWRVTRFLNSETSTVQGAKRVINNIQKSIGVGRKLSDRELSNYFKLSEKIQEYLQSAEQSAEALDYRAIFTAINKYVKDNTTELKNTDKVMQQILTIKNGLESESGGNEFNFKYLVDI